MSAFYVGDPTTNFIRFFILLLIGAVLVSIPFITDSGVMRMMVEIYYYIVLALMWNLLAGYTGLLSLGQHAFVGLGAYFFFILVVHLNLSPWVAGLMVPFLVAGLSVFFAYALFRLKGAYFAIGSWVVAETCRLIFAQIGSLGGGSGKTLPLDIVKSIGESRSERDLIVYMAALGLMMLTVLVAYLLLRSKYGLALKAIRDSELATRSLGVRSGSIKLFVYVVAAFFTSLAGVILTLQKYRVAPDSTFNFTDWTVMVIFAVVIGGVATIEGTVIGITLLFFFQAWLSDYGSWYLIFLGTIACIMVLRFPLGLWGILNKWLQIEFFPLQHKLKSYLLDEKHK